MTTLPYAPVSVFAIPLHDFIGPRKEDGRAEKGHVDEDLPLDVLNIFMLDIDERFEQMNAGDADQGSREFNLDGAGIDVGQPFRSIGMPI